jgi:outer membrane scaffolding protein for murein synthesis (MipA/OmpV family)
MPACSAPTLLRPAHCLTLCACLLSAGASAQDEPTDSTALPLWEAGIAAAGLSTPAYPASSQRNQRALVLPFLVYRGDVLRADRNGVGARMVHTDRFEFDLGFAGSLPASSNDIELRQGMPDLGTLIEFGPRVKMKLAEPAAGQRATFELPLRAVLEFNGGVRQVGYALEPKLAYEWRAAADWRLKSAASLVIGDQQLNQYFYGVSSAYANASRPAYEAQGGLIGSRLTVDGGKRLTPDVNIFAFARYDLYQGAANHDSPLFAQNQGSSLGMGLTWTLGRSDRHAGSAAQ